MVDIASGQKLYYKILLKICSIGPRAMNCRWTPNVEYFCSTKR